MDKIGFIGLGIMGKPMAKNLLKAGYDLTFYARRPEVVREMEQAGGKAVASSKAVAEATDVVVSIVTADVQVREVILGPVGVGQTVKIVNQLIGGINMAAIAEGLVMGIAAGADPEMMRKVVEVSSGNSTLFQARVGGFLLKDSFEPGFMLDLMKKDMGIAVDLAKALNIPAPIGAAAYQMYAAASRLGQGERDFSAVCRTVETLTGVKIGGAR